MIYAYVIHTCLDVALATKPENYKKKELMIYVALATKLENYKKKENCLSTHIYICCQKKRLMIYVALATKLENYKKIFMIYIHVIHVCLDVALMEGDLYPL